MDAFELPVEAQAWFNDVLVWVGYGTIVGLLAKAIMPGKDPGGTIATLGMGVTGVIIGCGIWSFATGQRVTPISTMGLAVGTAGALIILFFYRLLAGYWADEPRYRGDARPPRPRRAYRRRYRVADFYDE